MSYYKKLIKVLETYPDIKIEDESIDLYNYAENLQAACIASGEDGRIRHGIYRLKCGSYDYTLVRNKDLKDKISFQILGSYGFKTMLRECIIKKVVTRMLSDDGLDFLNNESFLSKDELVIKDILE